MQIINGKNLEILKNYTDNYFDAIVTDPPYGLGKAPNAEELMKDWIEKGYHEINGTGFMGKEWDAFVPQPIFWKEVYRVLKPGGHIVSFFGTRTYDWGVMAMRFAGFEVRDTIYWHYGSGFPKSHNIGKAIDKLNGAKREILGYNNNARPNRDNIQYNTMKGKQTIGGEITSPATEEAKQWEGWGSALKPASEPIVLARKPLEKGLSIAENVLKWGTGGINIDGCRIGNETLINSYVSDENGASGGMFSKDGENIVNGRFPANLILIHHPECVCNGLKKVGSGKEGGYNYEGNVYDVEGFVPNNSPNANSIETIEDWTCHEDCPIKIMDEQSGITSSLKSMRGEGGGGDKVKQLNFRLNSIRGHSDSGGASRFFYCAKASKSERNNGLDGFEEKRPDIRDSKGMGTFEEKGVAKQSNFHPTVKPVKLMQYLVRLITPPNGKVLDPFCGSGTTGIACKLEGFEFVGIEQDSEYCKIAEARIENYQEEPEEPLKLIEEGKSKFTQTTMF